MIVVPDDEPLMCTIDNQCFEGVCREGLCLGICESSVDCGTGQICVANICETELQPDLECYFNSDCPEATDTCINATCHQGCEMDADCANAADFCDAGVCRPDWRPFVECLFTTDCADGFECVDGGCRLSCTDEDACVESYGAGSTCERGFCQ